MITGIDFSVDPEFGSDAEKPKSQFDFRKESMPIMEDIIQEDAISTEEDSPENPQVIMNIHIGEEDAGNLTIELFPEDAPITVANFLEYVKDNFYEGCIFHRVIDGFMIQGGGYDAQLVSKERRESIKFEGENGLSNITYSVAMARGQALDSASSEFYINVAENTPLDHEQRKYDSGGYCVFGHVIDGFDIVDRTAKLPVRQKAFHEHVPASTVMIMKTSVVGSESEKANDEAIEE